jgi:hypothetical protein
MGPTSGEPLNAQPRVHTIGDKYVSFAELNSSSNSWNLTPGIWLITMSSFPSSHSPISGT